LTNLKKLSLIECYNLTKDVIVNLRKFNKNLRFDLSYGKYR